MQKCAINDDNTSFKVSGEESKADEVKVHSTTTMSLEMNAANVNEPLSNGAIAIDDQDTSFMAAPLLNLPKRLSCKWTSPVGPRIGCVRDYPIELQSQALEQVNLSPKVTPGRSGSCVPIPSPRPSPKIRVSPRLAYMGFPSPRVSINTAN